MSVNRISNCSTGPRKYPASSPTVAPITIEVAFEMIATSSDTLIP